MIEIMVAMVIFSLLIGSIYQIYTYVNKSWVDGFLEQQIMANMQKAQIYLEQDIKQAVLNPVPPYNYALSVTDNGNEIVIFENQPPPNENSLEQVYYYMDNTNQELKRSVVLPNADGTFPANDPTTWTILLNNVVGGDPYSGTVNTSGTAVTLGGGKSFDTAWGSGEPITINNVQYQIAYVGSATNLVLQTGAGVQTGAAYTHEPIFVANDSDSDHPSLSVDVTLECSNPTRPSVPLALDAEYAVRSNMSMLAQ